MVKIDKLIRSNRKSISIIIDRDGSVIVRAPKRVSKRTIQAFINEKEDWIRKTQEKARRQYRHVAPKRFIEGEQFLFLGSKYPLVYVDRKRPALLLNHRFELARSERRRAKEVFIAWYRMMAREVLTERADYLAARYGFTYQRVRITSAMTRWGSCNARGGLNFPWRLVMAPLEMIDYVVLHELVHTEVRNHSKQFWARVAEFMPDYKQRVAWFNEHGRELGLE
jgi:predicted metal-dependent hydrolase